MKDLWQKHRLIIIAAVLFLGFIFFLMPGSRDINGRYGEDKIVVTVAVSSIVEHPALDATRDGLRDGLLEAGYIEGENLKFQFKTAQGNPATAVQIARQYVGEEPDVLVGIATPTAQALASATKKLPIVFTAVTDPIGAGLVDNMQKPGGNVTGLSDLSPVAQHVEMIRQIMPAARRIGVVYNSGEANSLSLLALLRESAKKTVLPLLKQ